MTILIFSIYLIGVIINIYLVTKLIKYDVLSKADYLYTAFSILSTLIFLIIYAWGNDCGCFDDALSTSQTLSEVK